MRNKERNSEWTLTLEPLCVVGCRVSKRLALGGRAVDQDLISYLEGFRKDVMHKLEQMDGRLDQMDGKLGQMAGKLGQMEGRLDRVEESVRYARIEVEGLRGELRLVAEAFIGLEERLTSFRTDMAKEFTEVRSSIRQPFEYLDGRLRNIEVRADNATRDVMALVRERLGKPASPSELV